MNDHSLQQLGRSVLQLESEAVAALAGQLNGDFAKACRIVLACKGRVVVVGMGKSGHIGG